MNGRYSTSPAPGPRTARPWGPRAPGDDPGRALERAELVRRDHQAHGRTGRRILPGHRELHGRRLEQRREGARRALEREGLVGRVPGRPAAAQPAGERVLPSHHGLHRGRGGGHGQFGAGPRPPGRAVDRRELDRPHLPEPAPAGDLVELYSVSCTSATNCMAVGDDQNSSRHRRHDPGGPVERHDLDAA